MKHVTHEEAGRIKKEMAAFLNELEHKPYCRMVRAHCRRGKITHGGANTLWGKRLTVCMLCAIVVVVLAGMVGSAPLPVDHLETPSSPAGAISSGELILCTARSFSSREATNANVS